MEYVKTGKITTENREEIEKLWFNYRHQGTSKNRKPIGLFCKEVRN
ncbi:MAG: hypothetical protein ACTTJ7_01775 [Treponema sp.]